MNKRYARWYKRQIPQPVRDEMIRYQRDNDYQPEQSILDGSYVESYDMAPNITEMRRHDRDLMIMSDAVGDHNYAAIQRMWNAETNFMIFYLISPTLFLGLLNFLCFWVGGVAVVWMFEGILGSKPVIIFILWMWGYLASGKWIALLDIVECEFDYSGKYAIALKSGRDDWKKNFGTKIYNRIIGAVRLHLTIFNKWIGIAIVVLSVIYLSETDVHPDRFLVINWLLGWFFALLHIIWLVLFKLIPIYILWGWDSIVALF
jgi:hypothetical protein